jgi:phenylglyoxylate dehydrogenase beta subunit
MESFYGLTIDKKKCIGCRACEVVCNQRWNATNDLSRANVAGSRIEGEVLFSVCRHCDNPECLLVCPVGAILQDADGTVRIEAEKCVGCGICQTACSYGGLRLLPAKASKCDLCAGTPRCVALCPQGALEYKGQSSMAQQWKNSEDLVSPGISSCLGCGAEHAFRFVLRTLGKNTIIAVPPGCLSAAGVVGFGLTTGVKIPTFFPLLDNGAAMLSGVKRVFQQKGQDVNVVAFAGDGGTADIGFQSLSAAAERGENIIYICYDNEGYMNTGFQRSSTTPYGAWTSTTPVGKKGMGGKKIGSKNLPIIMADHEIPYAATACMAYPDDFERKLRKAMQVKDGLAYIHLLSPCPTGWRFPSEKGIEIARLAVETNFFPLWEMERGVYRFTVAVKEPKPVEEFLETMGKYRHLNRKQIQEIKAIVEKRLNILQSRIRNLPEVNLCR